MKLSRRLAVIAALLLVAFGTEAQIVTIGGPDGKLQVSVELKEGKPVYSVMYNNKVMLGESALGIRTNIGDFSRGLSLIGHVERVVSEEYDISRTKTSHVSYRANESRITFADASKNKISLVMRVSNNDIAYRYEIPQQGETACMIVKSEASSFHFPPQTTTFICPQSDPMIGWMRSKPSYEEEYLADAPMNVKSKYGQGYTFPCLFRIGTDGWVLLSETGVDGKYCGSHISDCKDDTYTIAYPMEGENNGWGSVGAQMALPGNTPWRTITVGETLKPIVETTVQFDVVEPLYEPAFEYKGGRSTWSWIMWQDNSVCYEDQIKFIDLASAMGWEYVLIDGLWDKQIGQDRMPELFRYAQNKGVDVFLWYNSNGGWNDAPQGAKQRMCDPIARKKEMKWLKANGVKGLKVDFFAGDKQETLKLYEAILSDANDYGLQIIFHGCTLPRGWERMFPNYCASEAVLASENLIFGQHANDYEAFNACLHPFIRNTVGSMDFGGTLLNKYNNRKNEKKNDKTIHRITTDAFQLATAIIYQSSVQNFAITPNNLIDAPKIDIDFMKTVPTTWDETRFIDGYPGEFAVIARRHADKWYVAGISAKGDKRKLRLVLPMFAGKSIKMICDGKNGEPVIKIIKVSAKGTADVELSANGGFVISDTIIN